MTDNSAGTVLYDGECAICSGSARRFAGLLHTAGFGLETLQNARPGEPMAEMLILKPDGGTLGGADALVAIARRIWWALPLWAFAHVPGVMPLLRIAYRKFAANRYCLNGACRLTGRRLPGAWVPLLVLPVITLSFRGVLAPWVFMWLLAFSIFIACRWLTLALAIRHGARPSSFRSTAYFLAWVGMDARRFLNLRDVPRQPLRLEWLFAIAKTFLGIALIWLCARFAAPDPLLCGWIGMIGIIFVLHFGLFHLLSLAWRWLGANAPPIMNAPLLSSSVAEFWGRRWNTAFHELVNQFTFRPVSRKLGVVPAMLLVFLLSGLIHDLLISLPAGGGFGLPTIYFLIQGFGVVAEHSTLGRRVGLGHGVRGRIFTIAITAGPAFWLFHPPFIQNVILPMLHAFGAT